MTRIGVFLNMGSTAVAEILADDLELLVLDLEHGLHTEENTQDMLRCLATIPYRWARVAGLKEAAKVLDLGANGILVPQIRSYEEAVQAVAACRYPPQGKRGLGPGRAALYGRRFQDLLSKAEQNEVWIQIETLEAVDELPRLLTIEGIDGFFIGPGDLSMELGIPGQFEHSKLQETISFIIELCKKHEKPWGIFAPTNKQAEVWIQRGAALVLVGSDSSLLLQGLDSLLQWKKASGE